VADTRKPALRVKDYRLYELEQIAAEALRDAERCFKDRRVDIERLILEKFKLKIETFIDLRRRWDTYAFIDTTGGVIFIDADLMNEISFHLGGRTGAFSRSSAVIRRLLND
jgi:hypothetical protein